MLRRDIADLLGLSVIGVMIILTIIYLPEKETNKFEALEPQEIKLPPVNINFGVITDSLGHYEGTVQRNESISDILREFDVDYATIDRLARKSEKVFDVTKIKRGNTYHVYYTDDSLKKVSYFVYESDKVNYVNCDLRNIREPKIFKGKKKVETKESWVHGTISSSLWMTLKDNGDDPLLALELSEIYAWTIDFFDIKKGDQYLARYTENYVEGERIGIDKIHSSVMIHKGEKFYAFHYDHDTIDDYFDEKGASMRRTFLKAPLIYSRISSGYSYRRYHPVLKIYRPHRGVDYAAPRGTPVFSIGDGEVVKRGYQRGGGGRFIKIKHNSMYTSIYMHLSGYATGIRTGKRVKQGDKIGYVGSSGLATGPHLDFRIYKHGSAVNPLNVESPPANPIDSSQMEAYTNYITPLKQELDKRLESMEE